MQDAFDRDNLQMLIRKWVTWQDQIRARLKLSELQARRLLWFLADKRFLDEKRLEMLSDAEWKNVWDMVAQHSAREKQRSGKATGDHLALLVLAEIAARGRRIDTESA